MTKDKLIELAQVGMGIHSPNTPEYVVCEALIKALAQPKQDLEATLTLNGVALYPQRTWVGLTLDERIELAKNVDWPVGAYCEYAEKIEAKLKEKNT
jgi:hypothetical protein